MAYFGGSFLLFEDGENRSRRSAKRAEAPKGFVDRNQPDSADEQNAAEENGAGKRRELVTDDPLAFRSRRARGWLFACHEDGNSLEMKPFLIPSAKAARLPETGSDFRYRVSPNMNSGA